jgi:hypothetical protein
MRNTVGTFLLYMLGTAAPIVVGAVGLQLMLEYGARPGDADSLLAQRIQTARDIRASLAKPIPPPPPLPPITAKPAHPVETKTADRKDTKSKVKRIPQEAWDAYAQGESPSRGRSDSYYSAPAYGGSGGW